MSYMLPRYRDGNGVLIIAGRVQHVVRHGPVAPVNGTNRDDVQLVMHVVDVSPLPRRQRRDSVIVGGMRRWMRCEVDAFQVRWRTVWLVGLSECHPVRRIAVKHQERR